MYSLQDIEALDVKTEMNQYTGAYFVADDKFIPQAAGDAGYYGQPRADSVVYIDGPTENQPYYIFEHASSTPGPAEKMSKGPRGRSLGEHSSRPIKNLREKARNGDMEAALKLGWSVERLTAIFNQHKAARGEYVSPGQPIDDLNLLARIQDRHKTQSEAAKKRSSRLKAQARAGDFKAAKKLKYGAKRMAELFPSLAEEDFDSVAGSQAPDGHQDDCDLTSQETVEMLPRQLSTDIDMPPLSKTLASVDDGPENQEAHLPQEMEYTLPAPYPMPPEGYDIELYLQREHSMAEEAAMLAREALTTAIEANAAALQRLQEAQRRRDTFQRPREARATATSTATATANIPAMHSRAPKPKKRSWESRASNFGEDGAS